MSWTNPENRIAWKQKNREKIAAGNRAYYLQNKEKCNSSNRKWKKANPDKWAIYQRRCKLRKNYGLSQSDYDKLLASQGGHCRFCEATEKLCVDHDHNCCSGEKSCGKCVRFLLCTRHNVALGKLENEKNVQLVDWFIRSQLWRYR